jgi:recombination associated protein RdgC
LTWLWFKSIKTGGRIEVPGKSTYEVIFLDRMVLDLLETDTPQFVSLKGEQSELREGLAAIREGKKIEEARILIRTGENDFTMVIKGTWFSFGSLRTPPILPSGESDDDEDEGSFLEKMYLLEQCLESVDSLFEFFLTIRVSDDWESTELPAIKAWIDSESKS